MVSVVYADGKKYEDIHLVQSPSDVLARFYFLAEKYLGKQVPYTVKTSCELINEVLRYESQVESKLVDNKETDITTVIISNPTVRETLSEVYVAIDGKVWDIRNGSLFERVYYACRKKIRQDVIVIMKGITKELNKLTKLLKGDR